MLVEQMIESKAQLIKAHSAEMSTGILVNCGDEQYGDMGLYKRTVIITRAV